MNCRCIEILTDEHKAVLRIADVLDSISTRARNEGTYNPEDVEAILHILRVFGDDCHRAKEKARCFLFLPLCVIRPNMPPFATCSSSMTRIDP
jgi:hemerythrin-like domain-containing protein